MNDDNQNLPENQSFDSAQDKSLPQSVVESVPIEEVPPEVATPLPEEVVAAPPNMPEAPPIYEQNKNQYLIIVAGVVIFVFLLIFFIKFFFKGVTTAKEVNLTYWGLWEDSQVIIPLIEQYRQKNPKVKIDYQKLAPQSYREKLIARSKNGQGPDIFRFHNTWLPEISELTSPLPSTIMTNTEFEKTFYKIHQKDLKVGNYYYGLPLEVDGLVLIYNVNLLKKAGIVSPPTTWDELTDDVVKLTVKDKKGNLITSGIAMGTTSNVEHFSDIFGLLLAQNGGSIKKLDGPEAAGSLEIYRKFAELPQAFWNDNMSNSITAFIQEKVGMIIVPSWEAIIIKSANPDINIKAVPVPTVPGTTAISVANYWVEGVSRFSKNQIEAWKFLRFLVEKDNLTKLYETESRLRLFGEPYSRVDLAPLLAQNDYIGAVIKQADSFISMPVVSRTYDNGLNDEIIKYIENAINSTVQGVSYSEALKTAKQGVDQVYQKYKIE